MFDSAIRCVIAAFLSLLFFSPQDAQAHPFGSFVAFESGPVRPLAKSPNDNLLFATNTPDNRLEIFRIHAAGLTAIASVDVGMEPVAVAVRSNTEVWVVNHLSDSISIVQLNPAGIWRTVRTLKVGDEPRDILFAGPDNSRAFITTAHRKSFEDPGAWDSGNADVWVFDTNNLGQSAEGVPLTVINFFSDVPRALAATPDGSTVYAAAFMSGNQTTAIPYQKVAGDLPPPLTNHEGEPVRELALIVKWDGQAWIDGGGRDMSHLVDLTLPDNDVFTIDANAAIPNVISSISGVGTTLFNMAVHPQSGKLLVTNLEARNNVRFEGPGIFGGTTVRGHFVENRITVIDGTSVTPLHLNKHIDYDTFPGTQAENDASLATPLEMVISSDGSKLYMAAYSSSKVGIFDTAELFDNSFVPDPSSHIEVTGGGPGGLVLDEARNRLYVLTRFDNSVSVIDLVTSQETAHLAMNNPEPASVTNGRKFLYDARYTSSRGNAACATCHIFGDKDELAWDLGNPDGSVATNPNPFRIQEPEVDINFHPMKGPMTTQSFRGMANHGPLHWRGDRTAASNGGDAMDENGAFKEFNGAFEGLIGRTAPLTEQEMQAFADFALQITYPPNPNIKIDNSMTPAQADGRNTYMTVPVEVGTGFTCNDCHVLDEVQGFFGTDGLSVTRARAPDSPVLKIAHIRNIYTKMSAPESPGGLVGPQARGFFLSHDGSQAKLSRFLESQGFNFPGGQQQQMNLISFLRAFPSEMAPAVGQQVTLAPGVDLASSFQRIGILNERAGVTVPREECDLIVKGRLNGEQRGWVRLANGLFRSDRQSESLTGIRALAAQAIRNGPGQELTFTCVPPGSGLRMGIDRDEDGIFDGDEGAAVPGRNPG